MKVVTSVTGWRDSVGLRLSATISEVDETGKITSDNKRLDVVVSDKDGKNKIEDLLDFAQEIVNAQEG